METITSNATNMVAKEDISQLTFPKEDVLTTEDEILERQKRINRAMTLGNFSKSKVRIIFEDNLGIKTVETTVWGVTNNYVILKKTTIIPIRRIYGIKFY